MDGWLPCPVRTDQIMSRRQYVLAVSMILLVGALLSIGSGFVALTATRKWEADKFHQQADARVRELISGLNAQLFAVSEVATDLARHPKVTERHFRQVAAQLIGDYGFAFVEWAPVVLPQDRKALEETLSEQCRQPIVVGQLRNGKRVKVANRSRRTWPVRYVWPTRLQTPNILALDRVEWLGRGQKLDPARLFYEQADLRPCISQLAVAADGQQQGILSVGFAADLFGISGTGSPGKRPVLVEVTDITGDSWAVVGSELSTMNPARDEAPVAGSPTQVARAQEFGPEVATYSGQHVEEVGGRRFRFKFRQHQDFAPGIPWLPFAVFVAGILVTIGSAGRWSERDNRQLDQLNQELTREIAKRREIQRGLQRLLEFRETERELVAHEIHDGFIQEVVGAQMFVQAIASRLDKQGGDNWRDLDSAKRLLSRAIEEGRRMISDLKPSVVDELGLVSAVTQLVRDEEDHYGFSISFRHSVSFNRLPPLVERTLYRVIQESLTNVKRHSGVREATVSLFQTNRTATLEIKDRGCGFDPAQVPDGHFGLRGIEERARLLHGHAKIVSAPGQGTCVSVQIPLAPATVAGESSPAIRQEPAGKEESHRPL
jgi:signal transduction histidine kinase